MGAGLSASEIARVLSDIEERLTGRHLSEAKSLLNERGLQLEFGRERVVLVVSDLSRIHSAVRPTPTASADDFCMAVRKRAVGRRVSGLEQIDGDRIVRFSFGAGPALVAELFGRHGELLLLDDDGTITHALTPRGRARIGTRFEPARPTGLTRDEAPRFSGDAAVAAHFETLALEAAVVAARGEALATVRDEERRATRKREKLVAERARADDSPRLRREAELLLAHRTSFPEGAARVTSVALPDLFEDGAPVVTIRVDPLVPIHVSAERRFKLARRLDRSRSIIGAEIARCDGTLRALSVRVERILAAASLDELETVAGPTGARGHSVGAAKRQRDKAPAKLPYRVYRATDGTEILVGKGAKENDLLTFRFANGSDVWLHAKDYPGSHVVVRVARGRAVSQVALNEAAGLAIHFSGAKGERVADVTCAERKNISKPRHAKPGLVQVARARTISVRLDPARLRALLERGDAD